MHSAFDLLSHGIALVPISYGTKGPANPSWNVKHNVLTNANQAHLAANINIGIAHAYCTPNATCAIDLDDFKAARIWLKSFNIDLMALLHADDAVVIHSGKVNSLKLLYRMPTGIVLPSKQIKNASNNMMLEFRCATADGLTVQDLLPPSVHPSGTQYRYLGSGSILALPEIPDALLKIWQSLLIYKTKKQSSQSQVTKNLFRSIPPETPRAVSDLQAQLSNISADCCYDLWRNLVWAILSTGWKCAEQLAKDWSMSTLDRYNEKVFNDVVNSYDPSRPDSPSLGTIYHWAKQGVAA